MNKGVFLHKWFIIAVGITIFISACGQVVKAPTPPHIPTDTPTPEQEATTTSTLTPIPTRTIYSVPTITPEFTLSSFDATATKETRLENDKRFFELIETNGDCELPCIIGITPGETSFENRLRSPGLSRDFSMPQQSFSL